MAHIYKWLWNLRWDRTSLIYAAIRKYAWLCYRAIVIWPHCHVLHLECWKNLSLNNLRLPCRTYSNFALWTFWQLNSYIHIVVAPTCFIMFGWPVIAPHFFFVVVVVVFLSNRWPFPILFVDPRRWLCTCYALSKAIAAWWRIVQRPYKHTRQQFDVGRNVTLILLFELLIFIGCVYIFANELTCLVTVHWTESDFNPSSHFLIRTDKIKTGKDKILKANSLV